MIVFFTPHSDDEYVRGLRTLPPRLETDVDDAARTDGPVLITGDPETAAWIARLIYLRAAGCEGPFRALDPSDTERSFGDRLDRILHDSLRSGAPGVLFVRDLAAAGPGVQAELKRWLADVRNSNGATPRLISSTSVPLEDLVETGRFDRTLLPRIARVHIRIADAGAAAAG